LAVEEKGKIELIKALLLYDAGKTDKGWIEVNSHKKKLRVDLSFLKIIASTFC